YRDGCCNTGQEDIGSHTVCAVMTDASLDFSKSRGNDLSTPLPELGFPGLKPGNRWCLCHPVGRRHSRQAKSPVWFCAPLTTALWLIARSPISNALQWTWPDRADEAPAAAANSNRAPRQTLRAPRTRRGLPTPERNDRRPPGLAVGDSRGSFYAAAA